MTPQRYGRRWSVMSWGCLRKLLSSQPIVCQELEFSLQDCVLEPLSLLKTESVLATSIFESSTNSSHNRNTIIATATKTTTSAANSNTSRNNTNIIPTRVGHRVEGMFPPSRVLRHIHIPVVLTESFDASNTEIVSNTTFLFIGTESKSVPILISRYPISNINEPYQGLT